MHSIANIIILCRTLLSRFVKESRPYLHIILLPYGLKEDVMMWGVEGHHLDSEIRYIVYALRAYAVEKPKSQDSQVYAELGPSLAEVSEIKQKIANRKHHLFAYFCLQGK